jgi:HrpA-like RNA helicase
VVTEGILTRRLQDDPALDGVGLLIFDEFHERSLDADLALALSLNGRELFRDEQPLKILLMSATLEGERLSGLLDDAPILRSEGRMYPVQMRWGRPFQPGEFIEPRLVQTILEALHDETAACWCFCRGRRRFAGSINSWRMPSVSAAMCCCARCMASLTWQRSERPSTRRRRASARWYWPLTSPRPA